MARPTSLTPDIGTKLVRAISGGNTRETSANYAGISVATLYVWLAKGRQQATGVYHEFLEAVEKAEAEAVITSVVTIREAARESWQAAAWWLERRYPDAWGRKDRVTIESMIKTEAEKIAQDLGLTVEEVMASAEAILKASD